MHIYALKGFKVIVRRAGNERDGELIRKHLVIGKEYTVEKTEVHNWHTDVFLQEVPDIAFNSVSFEDVSEQIIDDDRNHPDWARFN